MDKCYKKIQLYFFKLIIIMMPFISTLEISKLSFISKHGQFYPLFLGEVLWLFSTFSYRIIRLPCQTDLIIYSLFIFSLLLSGLTNITSMSDAMFQGQNGLIRYLLTLMKFFLFIITPLYIFNILCLLKINAMSLFEKCVYYSLAIVAAYSLLELNALFSTGIGTNIKAAIDQVIFTGTELNGVAVIESYFRVRSVASEASYFGMYMAVCIPYLFKCILNSKGIKKIVTVFIFLYFTLLIFLSLSRMAYFSCVFEILLLIFLFRKEIIITRLMIIISVVVITLVSISGYNSDDFLDISNVFLSFFDDDSSFNISNIGRGGSSFAALQMFLDNPLTGVGWGNFGFHATEYYPSWAWVSPEIVNWGTNTPMGGDWPPAHNLYARLLAETGIVGFLSYISIAINSIFKLIKVNGVANQDNKVFLVSFIGTLLDGFNLEDPYYIFWIMLGILWYVHKNNDTK